MRRLVVLLWLAAGASLSLSAQTVDHAGQPCASAATGIDQMEVECPQLRQALEDSGYAVFISDSQLAELSSTALDDLDSLSQRYAATHSGAAPDTQSLSAILNSLQLEQPAEPPVGWFARFKRWLRNLFAQQAEGDSWFSRWLSDVEVAENISQAIVIGSIALTILLALGVLLNELRVAGVFRNRDKQAARATSAVSGVRSVSFEDFDRTAPADRPSLLLRMLVDALVRAGRLRVERSLTHRELGVRATFDTDEQRVSFQRVAALAERVVYGDGALSPDAEHVLSEGRALQAALHGGTR